MVLQTISVKGNKLWNGGVRLQLLAVQQLDSGDQFLKILAIPWFCTARLLLCTTRWLLWKKSSLVKSLKRGLISEKGYCDWHRSSIFHCCLNACGEIIISNCAPLGSFMPIGVVHVFCKDSNRVWYKCLSVNSLASASAAWNCVN